MSIEIIIAMSLIILTVLMLLLSWWLVDSYDIDDIDEHETWLEDE